MEKESESAAPAQNRFVQVSSKPYIQATRKDGKVSELP
jgi:hypothetical protein